MTERDESAADQGPAPLEALAKKRVSVAGTFWGFFASNRKWWLLPPLIVMLLLALFFALSTTVVSPFVYTIF
jgi:hypothetical protein